MPRYQDIYPEDALLRSHDLPRIRALDLLTLEYFEAEPGTMPTEVFDQHHILINLKEEPHRVENWRDGVHRDFTYLKDEIIITPAGVESGWKWHAKSKVIVITLLPERFEAFARDELGISLTREQLDDLPQFEDSEITAAAVQLRDALESELGSETLFESFARVFLTKLIQKYGREKSAGEDSFTAGFTSDHYRRVFDFVAQNYGNSITVESMAEQAFLSPYHFARVFRETVGQTPHQFVTSYRIEQARTKLAAGSDSLGDIAIDCGFSDQAHFSRVFKKVVGKTPRQFRLATRKSE